MSPRREPKRLTEGLVITIEPIIAAGLGRVYTDDDDDTRSAPQMEAWRVPTRGTHHHGDQGRAGFAHGRVILLVRVNA